MINFLSYQRKLERFYKVISIPEMQEFLKQHNGFYIFYGGFYVFKNKITGGWGIPENEELGLLRTFVFSELYDLIRSSETGISMAWFTTPKQAQDFYKIYSCPPGNIEILGKSAKKHLFFRNDTI